MKVLLINGSPRWKGNTNRALEEAAAALEAEGVETELVWIGNKEIRGCIACGICHKTGDGRCGRTPGEAEGDGEGLHSRRVLGRNMAWMLKCIEAGRAAGINAPEMEPKVMTNVVREDLLGE